MLIWMWSLLFLMRFNLSAACSWMECYSRSHFSRTPSFPNPLWTWLELCSREVACGFRSTQNAFQDLKIITSGFGLKTGSDYVRLLEGILKAGEFVHSFLALRTPLGRDWRTAPVAFGGGAGAANKGGRTVMTGSLWRGDKSTTPGPVTPLSYATAWVLNFDCPLKKSWKTMEDPSFKHEIPDLVVWLGRGSQ